MRSHASTIMNKYAKSRFNLASKPICILEVAEEARGQREDTGAFFKFDSDFYRHRAFKMVADLIHSHESKVSQPE